MILGHIDPKTGRWLKGPPKVRYSRSPEALVRNNRGFSLQMPPGWSDGKPGINYVQHGPAKGRVCWSTRREAKEIAARYEGFSGERARYDPD